MKKWLILVLFSLLFVTGCQSESDKEIEPFRDAIKNIDLVMTTGFSYTISQTINNISVNHDSVELIRDRDANSMSTTYIEKKLSPFEAESAFTYKTTTTYFDDDRIGVENSHGGIDWQAGTMAEYLQHDIPIKHLYASYFERYTIANEADGMILRGELSNTNGILGFKRTTEYVTIQVKLNLDGKLNYVSITIEDEGQTIDISLHVFYHKQTVIIPT